MADLPTAPTEPIAAGEEGKTLHFSEQSWDYEYSRARPAGEELKPIAHGSSEPDVCWCGKRFCKEHAPIAAGDELVCSACGFQHGDEVGACLAEPLPQHTLDALDRFERRDDAPAEPVVTELVRWLEKSRDKTDQHCPYGRTADALQRLEAKAFRVATVAGDQKLTIARLEAEKETCERFELRHRQQIDVLIGENRIRDITITALQSERDRLREALEKIARIDYRGHPHQSASIARAALAGEK
jgi:hypothetical protein